MKRAAIILASCAACAGAGYAYANDSAALKALSGFSSGQYEIRAANSGDVVERVCLMSSSRLAHAGFTAPTNDRCVETIVEDTAERATMTYSCRGVGSGRTTIIFENSDHYTIDAQGIQGRRPFALRHEYKRTGDCK